MAKLVSKLCLEEAFCEGWGGQRGSVAFVRRCSRQGAAGSSGSNPSAGDKVTEEETGCRNDVILCWPWPDTCALTRWGVGVGGVDARCVFLGPSPSSLQEKPLVRKAALGWRLLIFVELRGKKWKRAPRRILGVLKIKVMRQQLHTMAISHWRRGKDRVKPP